MKRIYLSPPDMSGRERQMLLDAFDSNWIAPVGPDLDAFESEMCRQVGVASAVGLSSGTAGLHLALRLLGIGPGDDVLVSDFTFVATVNPIVYEGATPVFIDSDFTTWNMDPNLLEDELKESASRGTLPKAIIVVDLYGQCADYDAILSLSERYEVPVIEDAAEALGATWGGRPAGSFGELAVISFNGNKIITTSGGGMLLSDDEEAISKAHHWATQAREPTAHYEHAELGYNYRLSNLLAAVGRGQLEQLTEKIARRRAIFSAYQARLSELPGISFMPIDSRGEPNYWLTCLLIDPAFGVNREQVRLALEKENIESRPLWKPMHLQPIHAGCRVRGGSVSALCFEQGLCLPSGSGLSEEELERVITFFECLYRDT
jgi:dTDP-4-amino-4,6-dideoxygalactose transaminase